MTKYCYKAHETAKFADIYMPTGQETRFTGSPSSAKILAKEAGFTTFDVERQGICFLYQSRITYYKGKNWKRVMKLRYYGSIRYLKGKLSNG